MKFRTNLKYVRFLAILLFITAIYYYFSVKRTKSFEKELVEQQSLPIKTVLNTPETTKYVYQLKANTKNSVLFLSLIARKDSFGNSRSFTDFLEMITRQFSNGRDDYTLGLLVSSQELFNFIVSFVESASPPNFSRITVILDHRKPTERTHAKEKQKERRRFIATLRNTLVYSTMKDEDFLFWVDSDIIKIPSGMLNTMIDSGHDIITPGCKSVAFIDYDGNAWQGPRTKPSPSQIEQMKDGGVSNFIPEGVVGKTKHVSELKGEERFVEIDSVGGTVLFSKSEVFRQGINFPPYYVVGTDWERLEGWDGIETEGLCYVAKAVGYKCWAMPNDFVDHA